jgi:hypothetical protein
MEDQMATLDLVNPGYFPTLDIPVIDGRVWNETENRNGALLAVINRTMAKRYFPKGNAIGSSLKLPAIEERPPAELSVSRLADSWLLVVGIVEDSRNDGLSNPIRPAIYIPYTLHMSMGTQFLVRSSVPPATLVHAVRKQITTVNPDQQAYRSMEDLETWITDEPEWQQEHLVSWIFGGFAALALALAAVGLYSVVSYTVAQRTSEFGIRMALGARRAHVLQIVFASTLASVTSGILMGLTLTFALGKFAAKWAAGNAHDPVLLLEGTLILVLVAGMACIIPALRAANVNPMTALRCE